MEENDCVVENLLLLLLRRCRAGNQNYVVLYQASRGHCLNDMGVILQTNEGFNQKRQYNRRTTQFGFMYVLAEHLRGSADVCFSTMVQATLIAGRKNKSSLLTPVLQGNPSCITIKRPSLPAEPFGSEADPPAPSSTLSIIHSNFKNSAFKNSQPPWPSFEPQSHRSAEMWVCRKLGIGREMGSRDENQTEFRGSAVLRTGILDLGVGLTSPAE